MCTVTGSPRLWGLPAYASLCNLYGATCVHLHCMCACRCVREPSIDQCDDGHCLFHWFFLLLCFSSFKWCVSVSPSLSVHVLILGSAHCVCNGVHSNALLTVQCPCGWRTMLRRDVSFFSRQHTPFLHTFAPRARYPFGYSSCQICLTNTPLFYEFMSFFFRSGKDRISLKRMPL